MLSAFFYYVKRGLGRLNLLPFRELKLTIPTGRSQMALFRLAMILVCSIFSRRPQFLSLPLKCYVFGGRFSLWCCRLWQKYSRCSGMFRFLFGSLRLFGDTLS